MTLRTVKIFLFTLSCGALAGCGALNFGGGSSSASDTFTNEDTGRVENQTSLWDAFRRPDANTNVQVNKYLWNASLEVLNFLPVQSVDPFSGVISTGYGRPPGGGRAYRATILVNDAALEARSLSLAMQTRSGPVSVGTVRAVEDAILARARQLRIADGKL